MNSVDKKYGCWVVGHNTFDNKYDALYYANQTNQVDIKFYFHDRVWNNFDRNKLGKSKLTDLYKLRAQQLRDRYSHLVLHYSGGSDSHNILHTFLTNNIKLDEISIRWAKPLLDGKFYTPNTLDRSAKNAASEWDYAIKPTLDYLRQNHPEIKINIVDFTERLTVLPANVSAVEKTLMNLKMYRSALGSFVQRFDPEVEFKSSIKNLGNSIGHIFGIEKPMLTVIEDKIYLRFSDAALETALLINNINQETAELFYWAHDMPELTMEQAYQVALYFKNNPQFLDLLWGERVSSPGEASLKTNAQSNIVKKVLYGHSWDFNKFQVDKPNEGRSDWWHWIHNSSELENLKNSYTQAIKNITSNFDTRSLIFHEGIPILRPIPTNLFHILDLK